MDVLKVETLDDTMLIAARTVVSEVPCPECGLLSTRVHSRYRRTVWDLATGGRPVKVELEVRRFFCGEPSCDREIFAEQVGGLTQRRARRSNALRALLTSIAIALAGRAGARMAGLAGAPVSRSTLLRILRALPDPEIGQVTVLGVDDFAKKRAGLTLAHSSGAVEGTVNKIKFLKRQMFGRANFDLLRARVLRYS